MSGALTDKLFPLELPGFNMLPGFLFGENVMPAKAGTQNVVLKSLQAGICVFWITKFGNFSIDII